MMHPELRWAIYARDAGICGICGNPVHADDLDIDHIVQVVAGGSDHPDNLRATHTACNRRRGARGVPGAYLSSFKRAWGDQRVVNIRIRFPHGFVERIKTHAEADHRSFNAEVLVLLEEGMTLSAESQSPYDPTP